MKRATPENSTNQQAGSRLPAELTPETDGHAAATQARTNQAAASSTRIPTGPTTPGRTHQSTGQDSLSSASQDRGHERKDAPVCDCDLLAPSETRQNRREESIPQSDYTPSPAAGQESGRAVSALSDAQKAAELLSRPGVAEEINLRLAQARRKIEERERGSWQQF